MSEQYNKVRLNFFGRNYVMQTNDDPAKVEALAGSISRELDELVRAMPGMPEIMATVLTCIKYADKADKAEKELKQMESKIEDYVRQAATAQISCDQMQTQLDKAQQEAYENSPQAMEDVKIECQQKIEEAERRFKEEESKNCKLMIENNQLENELFIAKKQLREAKFDHESEAIINQLRHENYELAQKLLELSGRDDVIFSKEENDKLAKLVQALENDINDDIGDGNQMRF